MGSPQKDFRNGFTTSTKGSPQKDFHYGFTTSTKGSSQKRLPQWVQHKRSTNGSSPKDFHCGFTTQKKAKGKPELVMGEICTTKCPQGRVHYKNKSTKKGGGGDSAKGSSQEDFRKGLTTKTSTKLVVFSS